MGFLQRKENVPWLRNAARSSCVLRHSTSGSKLGQLLVQTVVAVLQPSLPQLHVLRVLGKRADLCLVLEIAETCLSDAERGEKSNALRIPALRPSRNTAVELISHSRLAPISMNLLVAVKVKEALNPKHNENNLSIN